MILGIEVGGTFTDLVLLDPQNGFIVHKTPSTPADPSEAAVRGIVELLRTHSIEPASITELLHGSTIAANALIQRRGSKTGLITTRGFGDVIFNSRANKDAIYDLFYRKPAPLLRRAHVFEVSERLAASGAVVDALDEADVMGACDALVACGIESIAVCLLHSYVNPTHERRIAQLIAARHPNIPVSLSSDIAPEHREYERASTTVISAYLRPAIDSYLGHFEKQVYATGLRTRPLIMQSNGGVVPIATARRLAANMFLSGPAAAATGASYVAKQWDVKNLITIDVGGTSSDVCLINDGLPQTTVKGTSEFSVDGLPLNVLMTDIVTVGAGGGSIAHVDAGGMLQVGPQSAGARPGPACYGYGGASFTLSDAMLLLGMLDADTELPGGIKLSRDLAVSSAKTLAVRFDLTPIELADRVYRIAVANMSQALRQVSVRRGYDPRNYHLFACGGVGPLIAVALASEAGIQDVLIPRAPGVFSAFGLAVADLRIDYVSAEGSLDVRKLAAEDVTRRLENLAGKARQEFASLGYDSNKLRLVFTVDARYHGQGYELRVPLNSEMIARNGPAGIEAAFDALHNHQYGLSRPGNRIDIVSFRLTATLQRENGFLHQTTQGPRAATGSRQVTFFGRTAKYTVLDRSSVGEGDKIEGPAIIVEETSSTIVPLGWIVSADQAGNLRLRANVCSVGSR